MAQENQTRGNIPSDHVPLPQASRGPVSSGSKCLELEIKAFKKPFSAQTQPHPSPVCPGWEFQWWVVKAALCCRRCGALEGCECHRRCCSCLLSPFPPVYGYGNTLELPSSIAPSTVLPVLSPCPSSSQDRRESPYPTAHPGLRVGSVGLFLHLAAPPSCPSLRNEQRTMQCPL